MIVCVCNNINDKKITQIVLDKNIISVEELKEHIEICNNCKICQCKIDEIIDEQNSLNLSI